MSVAEKLKALDEVAMYVTNVQTVDTRMYALSTLRRALPQIVAVVEAAENFVPHMDDEGGCHPDRYGVDCPEWLAIPAALSALDEKLGDVT